MRTRLKKGQISAASACYITHSDSVASLHLFLFLFINCTRSGQQSCATKTISSTWHCTTNAVPVKTTSPPTTGSASVSRPLSSTADHRSNSQVRGNESGTAYDDWRIYGNLRPNGIFLAEYKERRNLPPSGMKLCTKLHHCTGCDFSYEYIAVHIDCYAIYLHETRQHRYNDVLKALWRVGALRRPWKQAYPIFFDPPDIRQADGPWHSAFKRIAAAAGLQRLATLPLELISMIHGRSPPNLFWRAIRVVLLCQQMQAWIGQSSRMNLKLVPLKSVLSFERNGPLTLIDGYPFDYPMPYVQITVDRLGVRRVRQFSSPGYDNPERRVSSRRDRVYNFASTDKLRAMHLIYFKCPTSTGDNSSYVSWARLQIEKPQRSPSLWGLPHELEPCAGEPYLKRYDLLRHIHRHMLRDTRVSPPAIARNFTVDLQGSACSGLTIVFSDQEIAYVHSHRSGDMSGPERDCIVPALERMPQNRGITCIYVPIAPNDSVAFAGMHIIMRGTVKACYFVMRMKLAGDLVFGAHPGTHPGYAARLPRHHESAVSWADARPGGVVALNYGEPPQLSLLNLMGLVVTHSGETRDPEDDYLRRECPEREDWEVQEQDADQFQNPKDSAATLEPHRAAIYASLCGYDEHRKRDWKIQISRWMLLTRVFMSWAPLVLNDGSGVSAIRIFRHKVKPDIRIGGNSVPRNRPGGLLFRGMILYYDNGAERAIGECRVNAAGYVDEEDTRVKCSVPVVTELIYKPEWVCYRPTYTGHGTVGGAAQDGMECSASTGGADACEKHSQPDSFPWACRRVRGSGALVCSFSHNTFFLTHFDHTRRPDRAERITRIPHPESLASILVPRPVVE